MGFLLRTSKPRNLFCASIALLIIALGFLLVVCRATSSTICRTSCGEIPIRYPFGIDDGCGSSYYRHILVCTNSSTLILRTPSGNYPVKDISYVDPHIIIIDPSMWQCENGERFSKSRPFSLDTSTLFSLSQKNTYLFFNCNPDSIIIAPKLSFCERYPDRCDSSCDSASFLCRNIPKCPSSLSAKTSCCSYFPKSSESVRLMLGFCASYTSVYWKSVRANPPYDQTPEYGIRVDFDIPVTTRCLQCQDYAKGGGTCGYDTTSQSFLCLCGKDNTTRNCAEHYFETSKTRAGVIAGTTAVSVAGSLGIGALVWYLKTRKVNTAVACGVQSTENRLF